MWIDEYVYICDPVCVYILLFFTIQCVIYSLLLIHTVILSFAKEPFERLLHWINV